MASALQQACQTRPLSFHSCLKPRAVACVYSVVVLVDVDGVAACARCVCPLLLLHAQVPLNATASFHQCGPKSPFPHLPYKTGAMHLRFLQVICVGYCGWGGRGPSMHLLAEVHVCLDRGRVGRRLTGCELVCMPWLPD